MKIDNIIIRNSQNYTQVKLNKKKYETHTHTHPGKG